MSTPEHELPSLKEGYEDEFGPIDPAVYQAAREIWHKAVTFGEFALHDRSLVFNLMMKATADVSRLTFEGRNIEYLNAYLLKTFKRLVVDEREKRLRRAAPLSEVPKVAEDVIADLDRKVLVREIFTQLSNIDRQILWHWMRDYTFEEIAELLELKPPAVRKRMERLKARLIKTFANSDIP